jgi:hypothetical protein
MIILKEKKRVVKEGVWDFNGVKAVPVFNALLKIKKSSYHVVGSDEFFDGLDKALTEIHYLYWLMGKPQNKITFHKAMRDLNIIWEQIKCLDYPDKMPLFSWKECEYTFPKKGDAGQVFVKTPNGKVTGSIKVSNDFVCYFSRRRTHIAQSDRCHLQALKTLLSFPPPVITVSLSKNRDVF